MQLHAAEQSLGEGARTGSGIHVSGPACPLHTGLCRGRQLWLQPEVGQDGAGQIGGRPLEGHSRERTEAAEKRGVGFMAPSEVPREDSVVLRPPGPDPGGREVGTHQQEGRRAGQGRTRVGDSVAAVLGGDWPRGTGWSETPAANVCLGIFSLQTVI